MGRYVVIGRAGKLKSLFWFVKHLLPQLRPAYPLANDGRQIEKLRLDVEGHEVYASDHFGHPFLATVSEDMVVFLVRFGRHLETYAFLFQWLDPRPDAPAECRSVAADGSLCLARMTSRKRDLVPGFRRWRGPETVVVPRSEVLKAIRWRQGEYIPPKRPGKRSRLSTLASRLA